MKSKIAFLLQSSHMQDNIFLQTMLPLSILSNSLNFRYQYTKRLKCTQSQSIISTAAAKQETTHLPSTELSLKMKPQEERTYQKELQDLQERFLQQACFASNSTSSSVPSYCQQHWCFWLPLPGPRTAKAGTRNQYHHQEEEAREPFPSPSCPHLFNFPVNLKGVMSIQHESAAYISNHMTPDQ